MRVVSLNVNSKISVILERLAQNCTSLKKNTKRNLMYNPPQHKKEYLRTMILDTMTLCNIDGALTLSRVIDMPKACIFRWLQMKSYPRKKNLEKLTTKL